MFEENDGIMFRHEVERRQRRKRKRAVERIKKKAWKQKKGKA